MREKTFAISDNLPDLSVRAMKLILRIGKELPWNSAVWHFDHENNSGYKRALKELKDKNIIQRASKGKYIVNPDYLFKGSMYEIVKTIKWNTLPK